MPGHTGLLPVVPCRPIDVTDLTSKLRAAFDIGKTRTMQQDVTYGLRHLVDVSVKALSPSVNDPTKKAYAHRFSRRDP